VRRRRKLSVDREVVELLRDEPELLALADAVAATQASDARVRAGTRLWRRLRRVAGGALVSLRRSSRENP